MNGERIPLKHRLRPTAQRPLIIGHRGARAFSPENTIPSFKKAFDLGCDMVEVDVHLTKDRELVITHDDNLLRCTNVRSIFSERRSFFVSDFTLADIRTLDAGSWFVRELSKEKDERQDFLRSMNSIELKSFISSEDHSLYSSGTVGIPTLKEALRVVKARGAYINIEIKSLPRMYPGIARKVVEEVAAENMVSSAIISSFDHTQILEVKRLSPALLCGALTSDRLACVEDYLRAIKADAYHPGCYGDYDSVGFGSTTGKIKGGQIRRYIRGGGSVVVWTCNSISRMRQLASLGVQGLVTDYPNRGVVALGAS